MPYRQPAWYAIGTERTKREHNFGTLWRSAACFDAKFVFTIGRRFERHCSDTVHSWTHVPAFSYEDVDDFLAHRPYDVPLVGVELTEDAQPLESFVHPQRAIYILGPEDGSLSKEALNACQHVVSFSSKYCLNVAMAGSIVAYDRKAKEIRA